MGSLGTYYDAPSWHPLPSYHLKAPRGWINDPCAPGYDESTGTYHLFYQWNPDSCDWGNIAWGHFTSRDGVHWEHNGTKPALRPDQPYDDKGIFTGCFFSGGPKGEKGENLLTVVYSSVMALPIHWTIPYTRNCAGLALATSGDGGRTWEKSSLNPILDGEPDGLTVTGFRDPVLAEWPAMNAARGVSNGKGKLYGLVSGGVVGQGPNAFVYEVPADDLTSWSYIGPLVNVPEGFQRPSHWTGDFGVNWECVNFMTLADEVSGAEETQILIMGTEGGLKRDVTLEDQDPHSVWAMWMGGSLKMTADGVRLEPEFTGFLDNGCFYAANSYEHPVSGKRIVWGWIKEEDLTLARRESKGWTGYLCLQRELFLFTANNVVGTIGTPLEDVPSFKVVEGDRGRTVQTLGIRPLQELQSLRKSHPLTWNNVSPGQSGHMVNARSTNWELEALIRVHPGDRKIGFDFGHNRDKSHKSRVYFSVTQEEIVVDRSMSNAEDDIQKDAHSGPFTLLVSEGDNGRETETLRLHIFRDGDVLEVFANDRFALSTVVYSDSRSCNGISWFVESEQVGTKTVFESISIWEGLQSIETSMSSHL